MRRYEFISSIKTGSYGKVWQGLDKQTQRIVAVKNIFGAFQNATDAQRVYREITFLNYLKNHPNIVELIAVHKSENEKDIYLVFEFLESDLLSVIRAKILLDVHHRYIFWQLLCSLKYIHSCNIIHRDLKPSNILINSDSQIKLCDFGLARMIDSECSHEDMTDYIAVRWYRAPEILFGSSKYSFSADLWAAGCILAELVSGKPLFPGTSTMDQLERIISFTGPLSSSQIESMDSTFTQTMLSNLSCSLPRLNLEQTLDGVPADAIDLIKKLLVFDPRERLSAVECLEHPYVAQFHSKEREMSSNINLCMTLSDYERFTVEEYRDVIYREAVTPTTIRGISSKLSSIATPNKYQETV